MKARLIALPMTLAFGTACFPGYRADVVVGTPTTEFVKGEKREAATKNEVKLDGSALRVKVWSEYTCYGNNVTTTPQKRVYKIDGINPVAGIAVGVVSAALFGAFFLGSDCDPDAPKLFNQDTTQSTCDLMSAGGTLVGFSGTLAYGATSAKALFSPAQEEEMAPEVKTDVASQSCGAEPIKNTPLIVYMPSDKSLSYVWTDAEGNATLDVTSLIDPSVASGNATVSFATAAGSPFATLDADKLAGLRKETWSPDAKGEPTNEVSITRAHYDLSDKNEDIRMLSVQVKLKNPGTSPLTLRARLASDHPGVNGRTVVFENLAPGAEEEKVLSIELPKLIQDPSKINVLVYTKTGAVANRITAKTGPEEAPAPAPVTPAPAAATPAPTPAPAPAKGSKTPTPAPAPAKPK